MADGGSNDKFHTLGDVSLDRPSEWEIASAGADEFLQGFGGDPYGGVSSVGLRVPFAAPVPGEPATKFRYLFLLATFTVGEGQCVRIKGYRQLLTIGLVQSHGAEETVSYPVEQLVTSPFWRFVDGNVSWHMMRLGPPNASSVPKVPANGAADCASFKLNWGNTPALLYGNPAPARPAGNIYPNVVGYVPPNGGRPYGTALSNKFGTFYDLRTQWLTHGGWSSMDFPVRGPETVAFFASILQTNPSERASLSLPGGTFYPNGLSNEEQFLLNFPTAQYYRVGGALRVQAM